MTQIETRPGPWTEVIWKHRVTMYALSMTTRVPDFRQGVEGLCLQAKTILMQLGLSPEDWFIAKLNGINGPSKDTPNA